MKAFKAGKQCPTDSPIAYYCKNKECNYKSAAYKRWKQWSRANLLTQRREFSRGLELADSSEKQRLKAREIINSFDRMLLSYYQVCVRDPQMPIFNDQLRQAICLYLWQDDKASDLKLWGWVDGLGIPLKDNLTLDSKSITYVLCYLSKNKQLKHRLENITNPVRRAIRDAREAQLLDVIGQT